MIAYMLNGDRVGQILVLEGGVLLHIVGTDTQTLFLLQDFSTNTTKNNRKLSQSFKKFSHN